MTPFEVFAARKTAEASGAALQPFVTDLDRAAGVLEPIGNEWSRRLFGGKDRGRIVVTKVLGGLHLNMRGVSFRNGQVYLTSHCQPQFLCDSRKPRVASDGVHEGIDSQADKPAVSDDQCAV